MEQYRKFNIAILTHAVPGKGRALKVANDISKILSEMGIPSRLFVGDWPGHFEGFSDVWISGGDGTLNFFINRYPEIKIPLAIFKGGTGNDFATELYGTLSVRQQVDKILSVQPRPIDAGLCNDTLFLNVTGIGFDGEVLKSMGFIRWLGGSVGYMVAIVKEIFFFREPLYTITGPGLNFEGKLFLVTVANSGTTGGGFRVSPLSSVVDGQLDLITGKPLGILKRLLYLPRVKSGRHLGLSVVNHYKGEYFTIECKDSQPAQVDGEMMVAKTFRFRVIKEKFLFRF